MDLVQAVTTKAELLRVTRDHPAVEFDQAAQVRALVLDDGPSWAAVAVKLTLTHGSTLDVVGSDTATAARLVSDPALARLLAEVRPDGVTVDRALAPDLLPRLGLEEGRAARWEWMITRTPPPPTRQDHRVVVLDEDRADELTTFIDAVSPRADARPFAWPGQEWVGVRADDGTLAAVGCRMPSVGDYPLLAGIATHPAHRGQGLGAAVTAELTRRGLAEAGVCTLEMYSTNATARRIYRRLGYGETREWTSTAFA